MAHKLAISKLDEKNRTTIPREIRSYLNIRKNQEIVFWEVEERIIIEKIGAGTPNPFNLPRGYRPFT